MTQLGVCNLSLNLSALKRRDTCRMLVGWYQWVANVFKLVLSVSRHGARYMKYVDLVPWLEAQSKGSECCYISFTHDGVIKLGICWHGCHVKLSNHAKKRDFPFIFVLNNSLRLFHYYSWWGQSNGVIGYVVHFFVKRENYFMHCSDYETTESSRYCDP